MKLKELIKLFEERQTICLIIDGWSITIPKEALEYYANDRVLNSTVMKIQWNLAPAQLIDNDKALNGTVMKIAAENVTPIVVCASCAKKEHNGCEGCRHFDLEENDEPCASCKGTATTREEKLARRDYFERCEEDGK